MAVESTLADFLMALFRPNRAMFACSTESKVLRDLSLTGAYSLVYTRRRQNSFRLPDLDPPPGTSGYNHQFRSPFRSICTLTFRALVNRRLPRHRRCFVRACPLPYCRPRALLYCVAGRLAVGAVVVLILLRRFGGLAVVVHAVKMYLVHRARLLLRRLVVGLVVVEQLMCLVHPPA